MATTGRYLFGNPPFRFLAGHLAQDDDFLNDGRVILTLEDDASQRLSMALQKSRAFLSVSAVEDITKTVLEDAALAKRVASIVSRIASLIHDADMPLGEAMDALGVAIMEKSEGLQLEERK